MSEQHIAAFYDALSTDYDAMTGFEKRFAHERPFFRLLVEQHGIRSAVDAGCGSGFHSLLLASLGVDVTAVDISPEMLKLLCKHALEMRLEIRTSLSSFADLGRNVASHNDAVFCMGNSLAHLLSKDELFESLRAFARVLKPGGLIFTQNLNNDRIMSRRERIQSAKESGGVTYVRFYEYTGETIQFHILKMRKEAGGIHHELNSVELRPVLEEELLQLLREAGFIDAKSFGGVAMEEFHRDSSKDLVVLAIRAGYQ